MLIQSRIEGVALSVAWQYLSLEQKRLIKDQTRDIVKALFTLKKSLSYVFPDPDPVTNKGIPQAEYEILWHLQDDENSDCDSREVLGFAHNDLQPSNIIVKDDKIVGVVDWEMSGFFGERAKEVHQRMRCPGREAFQELSLSEEHLEDLTFWHDLYDY